MKYRIFVSGVQKELKQERFAVKGIVSEDTLLKEYFDVFLFEDSPAKSKSAKEIYIDKVQESDIYVGIIGDEYGKTGKGGLSATEQEFHEASKKERFVFIKGANDNKKDKKTQELISEIKNEETGVKYKRFNTVIELKNNIHDCLIEFLRDAGIVGKTVFEQSVCENAKFDDIDEEKIKWFLQTAKIKRKYPLGLETPLNEVFTHLNLLHKDKLTNAAILLFGKNPHNFHSQAKIKCLQFSGTDVEKPFSSYHIYDKENLFEQIDKAESFVLDAIRFPVIQQEHTVQVKRPPEIPVFAIHEAIVNAVAHRNYNTTAAIQVMVFIDRVEIWNPGKLPSQLTLDKLMHPHTSYPNNPLIADVLYLADYIQEAGSGILEMIKQCKESSLPEPVFIEDRGEFKTVFARDIFTETVLNKLGFNERQLKAVKYVKGKGRITNLDYQKLTGASKPTSTRDLNELVEKSVFQKHGTTGKGTLYKLKGS